VSFNRCVLCDVDLTQQPHLKLCWHGVPGAKDGEKGDLCDPCHELWKAEERALVEARMRQPDADELRVKLAEAKMREPEILDE
jgi:hypothetical protein